MVSLLRANGRGPGAARLPAGFLADPAGDEGAANPLSNLVSARGFDHEERAQINLVIDALRRGLMWSERTRELMLPTAAKRDGDRRPGCTEVAIGRNAQDRVLGECLAHVPSPR